jgi:SAM-dependent methyltransferase
VDEKFYGCGAPLPSGVAGLRVLDLGSGSGRDCYVMSKFVGEHGSVVGIDMTDEQLAVAREHTAEFTAKLGCVLSPPPPFRQVEELQQCTARLPIHTYPPMHLAVFSVRRTPPEKRNTSLYVTPVLAAVNGPACRI